MFISVYRLHGDKSDILVFSTQLVYCCPSNLLSGSLSSPSPLPCVTKYTVYMYTVCKGGAEGYGVIGGKGASER
jgi:hypothetical protein